MIDSQGKTIRVGDTVRAMAIDTDLSPFITRPWALFFLIAAVFSAAFPFYQAQHGKKRWADFYMPLVCLAISVPLFLMGGMVRPAIGGLSVLIGLWLFWQRRANSREKYTPTP